MPNWTTNEVKFTGEKKDIAALRTLMGDDFNFNAIIPKPASLDVTDGSITDLAIMYYLGAVSGGVYNFKDSPKNIELFSRYSKNFFLPPGDNFQRTQERLKKELKEKKIEKDPNKLYELGKTYVRNKDLYGHTTWFTWCNENWGTKWDACDCEITEEDENLLVYSFSTAWTPPLPIYKAIHEKFPGLKKEICYKNEDEEDEFFFTIEPEEKDA